SGADPAQEVDEGLVRLPGLRREAREERPEVAALELRVLVELAREEAAPERAVGDEVDPELLERREDLGLGAASPERVLALHRGDRLHGVRAADRPRAGLGEAEMLDLAGA